MCEASGENVSVKVRQIQISISREGRFFFLNCLVLCSLHVPTID